MCMHIRIAANEHALVHTTRTRDRLCETGCGGLLRKCLFDVGRIIPELDSVSVYSIDIPEVRSLCLFLLVLPVSLRFGVAIRIRR